MIRGKHLAQALLLTGSCICGGLNGLYAQNKAMSLPNPGNITEQITYDEDDGTYRLTVHLDETGEAAGVMREGTVRATDPEGNTLLTLPCSRYEEAQP